MARIGVKDMRALSLDAMRAEAHAKDDPARAAYCRGVFDAMQWAMTGDDTAGIAGMREFLLAESRLAAVETWANPSNVNG